MLAKKWEIFKIKKLYLYGLSLLICLILILIIFTSEKFDQNNFGQKNQRHLEQLALFRIDLEPINEFQELFW